MKLSVYFSGLLIVHKAVPQYPQHGLLLTDWFHVHYNTMYLHNRYDKHYGSGDLQYGYDIREFYVDGSELATFTYVSSLIGGRGRRPEHQSYPLAEYQLVADAENHFRLVCGASEYSYEMLADGHSIMLIALDGNDIQPVSVDSFIINPGETVDFRLIPDQNTDVQSGRYWLRARTLGAWRGFTVEKQKWNVTHEVKAILAYDSNTRTDPTSSERQCLSDQRCRVFNCPFAFYPPERNRTCLPVTSARSAYISGWLDAEYGLNDHVTEEYFLNVGFVIGSSINAVKFIPPRTLLKSGQFDSDRHVKQCPAESVCQQSGCLCTHIKRLPYNKTIQVRNSPAVPVVRECCNVMRPGDTAFIFYSSDAQPQHSLPGLQLCL